jgi:hypothetical protein
MGQFPEHDTIDTAEDFRFIVDELIERRPAFQLSVDGFDHIDFAFTVSA